MTPAPVTATPATLVAPVDGVADDRAASTTLLFVRLTHTTDPAQQALIRAQIAALNVVVARTMARRYRGRGEPEDDLEQVACVGLMKAVNGFEPGYGRNFLSYAVPTISGELKKYFRDCCWTVKPTRRIQELQREISTVAGELIQDLGREPGADEVAAELEEDVSLVCEAISAFGCYTPTSLDACVDPSGNTSLGSFLGAIDIGFSRAELHAMLSGVVRDLCERDRRIVALRFYHDYTQRQIADEIGVTQMQVSRLLTRIMTQLRTQLS